MGRGRRTAPINRDGHAIGLDLGATSVRAAVLTMSSKGGRMTVGLRGAGSVPLPAGAVVNGAVIQPAEVTRALKKLWEVNRFDCRRVILGVANPQVVVRPLQIPNLNAAQRAKALPFQARDVIALPLDEVILDFATIGAPDPTTGLLSGLLIATPRRPVLVAVDAVERAGLKVARIDLASFGALRSIGDEHMLVQAVIDVGAHLTSIVIHHQGIPQLVRTLPRGGQELTDLLVERLDMTPDEAENVKQENGIAGARGSVSTTLEAGIRPLLAEIRSSINYFRVGNGGVAIDGISLTGGGSALLGLAAALADQNGIPTDVITPMRHIQDTAVKKGRAAAETQSAVAVGLAMGAAA